MTNTEKLCVNCGHREDYHHTPHTGCRISRFTCTSFLPSPAIPEAGKEKANFMQVGKGHCFFCHSEYDDTRHFCAEQEHSSITACSNHCPDFAREKNPLNEKPAPHDSPAPPPDIEGYIKLMRETFFQDTTGERVEGWLAMKTGKLIAGDEREFCKIAIPNDVESFLRHALTEYGSIARDEGYEAGLNLRHEYNDPELMKQIENKARNASIDEVLALIEKTCDPYHRDKFWEEIAATGKSSNRNGPLAQAKSGADAFKRIILKELQSLKHPSQEDLC